ncbi:Excalibur calcium-binding domain-containing protein [Kibdelosporangium sp. 4NS15]|uniref:Excalibur calcium-binding domain-containing protein n=1 Tax=Kibdelosporangium persicum TaxID=2698649 RepID=A0ABX2F523_9PSEU|nr:excalibur calcium-binding domain-containing protein [Kibdelosporangium persicum]NRN66254.1 Excalibur calcium-binding domain-containing protein [Kibdelosporangium persicum]
MTLPLDLAGKTAAKVEQELRALGFTALRYLGPNGAPVTVDSTWTVVSVDGAGSSVSPDSEVTIRVDKPVPPPPPKTTPKVTPKPAPPRTEEPAPPVTAYYKNCTAARAAGAAPVHRGDPGYGRHLDRDGDGVGCE